VLVHEGEWITESAHTFGFELHRIQSKKGNVISGRFIRFIDKCVPSSNMKHRLPGLRKGKWTADVLN
jgi:hypothetical protein